MHRAGRTLVGAVAVVALFGGDAAAQQTTNCQTENFDDLPFCVEIDSPARGAAPEVTVGDDVGISMTVILWKQGTYDDLKLELQLPEEVMGVSATSDEWFRTPIELTSGANRGTMVVESNAPWEVRADWDFTPDELTRTAADATQITVSATVRVRRFALEDGRAMPLSVTLSGLFEGDLFTYSQQREFVARSDAFQEVETVTSSGWTEHPDTYDPERKVFSRRIRVLNRVDGTTVGSNALHNVEVEAEIPNWAKFMQASANNATHYSGTVFATPASVPGAAHLGWELVSFTGAVGGYGGTVRFRYQHELGTEGPLTSWASHGPDDPYYTSFMWVYTEVPCGDLPPTANHPSSGVLTVRSQERILAAGGGSTDQAHVFVYGDDAGENNVFGIPLKAQLSECTDDPRPCPSTAPGSAYRFMESDLHNAGGGYPEATAPGRRVYWGVRFNRPANVPGMGPAVIIDPVPPYFQLSSVAGSVRYPSSTSAVWAPYVCILPDAMRPRHDPAAGATAWWGAPAGYGYDPADVDPAWRDELMLAPAANLTAWTGTYGCVPPEEVQDPDAATLQYAPLDPANYAFLARDATHLVWSTEGADLPDRFGRRYFTTGADLEPDPVVAGWTDPATGAPDPPTRATVYNRAQLFGGAFASFTYESGCTEQTYPAGDYASFNTDVASLPTQVRDEPYPIALTLITPSSVRPDLDPVRMMSGVTTRAARQRSPVLTIQLPPGFVPIDEDPAYLTTTSTYGLTSQDTAAQAAGAEAPAIHGAYPELSIWPARARLYNDTFAIVGYLGVDDFTVTRSYDAASDIYTYRVETPPDVLTAALAAWNGYYIYPIQIRMKANTSYPFVNADTYYGYTTASSANQIGEPSHARAGDDVNVQGTAAQRLVIEPVACPDELARPMPTFWLRYHNTGGVPISEQEAIFIVPTQTTGGDAVAFVRMEQDPAWLTHAPPRLEWTEDAGSPPTSGWRDYAGDPPPDPAAVRAVRAIFPPGQPLPAQDRSGRVMIFLDVQGIGLDAIGDEVRADGWQAAGTQFPNYVSTEDSEPFVLGQCPAELRVHKYFDGDETGAQGAAEPDLEDWDFALEVTATDPGTHGAADPNDRSATTDADGVAVFYVWPGQAVRVTESIPAAQTVATGSGYPGYEDGTLAWHVTTPAAAPSLSQDRAVAFEDSHAMDFGNTCSCDDRNMCTNDTCAAPGACSFVDSGLTCAAPPACKLPGQCNPEDGGCAYPHVDCTGNQGPTVLYGTAVDSNGDFAGTFRCLRHSDTDVTCVTDASGTLVLDGVRWCNGIP